VRLIALSALTVAMYALVVVTGAALDLYGRLTGSPGLSGPWRAAVFHGWARTVGALMGMRLEIGGEAPRPPFFLVANHLGYIDVILLAGQLRAVFVAKSEVDRWPVVGAMCRAVGTLFIDRNSKRDIPKVARRMERVLQGGRGLVVFPEGTSTMGRCVERFRPSLLDTAARLDLPVSFASLSYRTPDGCPPAHRSVCWWGDMEFGRHVWDLLGLPAFTASVRFGEKPIRESDRKVLARRLQQAVQRDFRAVV